MLGRRHRLGHKRGQAATLDVAGFAEVVHILKMLEAGYLRGPHLP
ncbi:hypothetical protein DFAR_440008 [Desulfarculales bacterium]